jgi:hypothetical protein
MMADWLAGQERTQAGLPYCEYESSVLSKARPPVESSNCDFAQYLTVRSIHAPVGGTGMSVPRVSPI